MRSNETIVILQAIKGIHMMIDKLLEEIEGMKDYLKRMEETGITLNIPVFGEDEEESGEEEEEEVQMV